MADELLFSVQAINPWGRPMHLVYEEGATGYEAIEQAASRIGSKVAHRRGDALGFDRRGNRALVSTGSDLEVAEPTGIP